MCCQPSRLCASWQKLHEFEFKTCRSLAKDGWFSYDLNASSNEPLFLVVKYWGGGWGPDPSGIVEIFIDSAKITTHDLANKEHETTFYDLSYPIPIQLTRDKKKINVRFRSKSGKWTSGIFSCKLVTAEGLIFRDLLKEQ